ncbi:hypothetical protein ACM16X_02640 [Haloarcula japonica]|uniref:hypothetical protein n=1 Tax=Haloarcula japonica TaxID=29282 RepID=UPI0039F720DC
MEDGKLKGVLLLVGVGVFALVSVMLAAGWIPVPDILKSPVVWAICLFVVFVSVIFYMWRSGSDRDIQIMGRSADEQLTKKEAGVLARYTLLYNELLRIGDVYEEGIEKVQPSDQSKEPVRLYKIDFEPKNRKDRVVFFMDLEQKFSVDTGCLKSEKAASRNHESVMDAVAQIQNSRLIFDSKKDDFQEAVQDVRDSLGRTVRQKVIEREFENGEKVGETEYPMASKSSNGGV